MGNPLRMILSYLKDKKYRFTVNNMLGIYKIMPDKKFILKYTNVLYGENLNLDSPRSLNEKLQWLKLYDHNPIYSILADKYAVKEYIANIIGSKYIIPTLGVWDNFDDIDFDALPDRFVLKPTHDSGGPAICSEKKLFNKKQARKMLEKRLKRNHYYLYREWAYKDIKPRIIAEEFIQNKDGSPIVDYKFYCFGGELKYFMFSIGEASHNVRNHKFDANCNSIDYLFKSTPTVNESEICLPDNIDEMIEIVKKICVDFPFIRVDLYNVDGKIYFGETTLYSGGGYLNIQSEHYSNELARLIDIEMVKI